VECQNSAKRHAESKLKQLLANKAKLKENVAVENAVLGSKIGRQ